MKTEDIILVLDNAVKLKDEVQDRLEEYVHDKNIPLKERFRVWVVHCDKEDEIAGFDSFHERERSVEIHVGIDVCDEKKETMIHENCSHAIIL